MKRPSEGVIDGDFIQYGNGLALECRAKQEEDPTRRFDFREYFDERTAQEQATAWALRAAKIVLKHREESTIPHAIEFPGAKRVYKYVNHLGLQPVGKLVYVETMPKQKSSGATYPLSRQSVVIKDKIEEDFSGSGWEDGTADYFNGLRTELVAVHELAHLAGSEDKITFNIPQSLDRLGKILPTGSTLSLPYAKRGGYFEEGLASFIASTYIWNQAPDIKAMTETQPYGTSSGAIAHIPVRNTFIGYQYKDICGWGIEQLISIQPRLWNALLESRKYHATKTASRLAIRRCLNRISRSLFHEIDSVDDENIEKVIEVTDHISYIASRHR